MPHPLPSDLIPIQEEITVGKGVLDRLSFLQGKMNVALRNDSSEKKPVAIRFYILNANGIILDQHDVRWWFKQMDPGTRTIETVTIKPSLPKSLKYLKGGAALDAAPKFLLIRSTDDSPYGG